MSDAKQRILYAAIEEFGVYGYKGSSTDRIVSTGKVSKGLLFYHYGSKENLYMECVHCVVELFMGQFEQVFDKNEKNFFKRFDIAVDFKVKFLLDNPVEGRFLIDVGKTHTEKIIPQLDEYVKESYKRRWNILTDGVDTTRYRKDIPVEKIHEYMFIVIDAYTSRYHFELMKYDQMFLALGDYFNEIKLIKDLIFNGVYPPEQDTGRF